MTKRYQYCVAENWGKGFINHVESSQITFRSFPGDVWQVPAHNKQSNLWIAKVAGAAKTKDEAQTIVTGIVTTSQNAWDADNVESETAEEKIMRAGPRHIDITLTD